MESSSNGDCSFDSSIVDSYDVFVSFYYVCFRCAYDQHRPVMCAYQEL